DTGIDYNHARLGGGGFPNSKVLGGYDFGDGDSDPIPNGGQAHGTACSGIAAGDLGTVGDYIGGVAYNAKLYALKISAGTTGEASSDAMVAAWDWCVTHRNDNPSYPIMVISTSFGGGRYYSTLSGNYAIPSMTTAANNAVAAGITVLASSGNEGYCDSIGWPACISSVISVGAVYDAPFGNYQPCVSSASCAPKTASTGCTSGYYSTDSTAADKVTSYSNTASFLTLLAPANRCYTLDITGSTGWSTGDYFDSFGGTSAACPYAAGAVACVQSAAKARTGSFLTPQRIRSLLIATGDAITDTKVAITKPRVNLERAIQSLPAAPTSASASPDTICRGASSTLTATGGSGDSCKWYTGSCGGTLVGTGTSIVVSPATTTQYWVRWVTTSYGNSTCATATVTVNPLPPVAPTATNNGPVCASNTLEFTASTVAGATYAWTGPNGFTSDVQNPSIANATSAASGVYSVTATVSGCTSTAGTTSVVVNSLPDAPTAGSNAPICEGGTLNLTASTVEGATYAWTGPNGFTSDVQNPSITNATTAASGIYSITTTKGGCTSTAGTTSVEVNAIPVTPTGASADPATISVGGSCTLTASGGSGDTCAWYTESCGGTPVGTGTSIIVSPTSNTTYYVRWETAGCGNSACASVGVVVADAVTTGGAKKLEDDAAVSLNGKVVTYQATDFFYIEEESRAMGIRVEKMAHGLTVGMKADVVGTMKTNTSGERYVLASSAAHNGDGVVGAVGMKNSALGGEDWQLAGTGGQKGAKNSIGLNNIGLLVRTAGRVTYVGLDFFYLDDGSNLQDTSAYTGVKVEAAGLALPTVGDFAIVTGVCSGYGPGDILYPQLLVRGQNDIQVAVSIVPANVTISDYVRNNTSSPIEGVRGLPGELVTKFVGFYPAEAPSGWSGTVMPTKTCYVFE
ncbi:MAG: S8 family serine peptidase, partial [Armatimonadota bacterium]